MSFFDTLGLADPVLRALKSGGYADPTPIQQQAIPPLMEGHDLCGIAQTGTGKTAAFSLPSLSHLANNSKRRMPAACRMLVLAPTRELAAQIAEKMRGYSRHLALSIDCVFGGVPIGKQARRLTIGTDILVATPGRLLDLIDNRALTLRHVEIFVLDEADQMLDLGFIHALKRIATMLPKDRQSLFFSATMPKSIADLGSQFLNNPVQVAVKPQATTAERVTQQVVFVDQREKPALLSLLLKEDGVDRALVFTRTKHGADRVVRQLAASGIRSAAIHGNKSQAQRTAALQGFRHGHVPILIATDIAARGIDVSGVSHVFNYEMPNVAEQYVHRIGRTARAGADGAAISFVAPDEKASLRDVERLTRIKLDPRKLPENFREAVLALPKAAPAPAESEDRFGRRDMGRGGARGGERGGERGRPSGDRAQHPSRSFAQGRDGRTRDGVAVLEGQAPRSYAPKGPRGPDRAPRNDAPRGDRPYADRADAAQRNDRNFGDRPRSDAPRGDFVRNDNRGPRTTEGRSYGDKNRTDAPRNDNRGDRPSYGDRPQRSDAPRGDRPSYGDRPQRSDAPRGDRPSYGDRPQRSDRPAGDRPRSDAPRGDRPSYGDRPQRDGQKPGGNRPYSSPAGARSDRAAPRVGGHKHAVKRVV